MKKKDPKSRQAFEIKAYESKKEAERESQLAGFNEPKPPKSKKTKESKPPKFPEDITLLSNQKLGRLMSRFTAWAVYAETKVSMTDIDYTIVSEVKDFVESKALLDEEGASLSERKAAVAVQYEIRRIRLDWLKAKTRLTMFKAHLRRFERGSSAVSREISRRSNIDPFVKKNLR